MKKFLVFLLLTGCMVEYYATKDFAIGDYKTVSIGEPMLRMDRGTGSGRDGVYNGDGFALFYGGISHDTILVHHQEYVLRGGIRYAIMGKDGDLRFALSDTVTFQAIKIKVDTVNGQSIIFRVLEAPSHCFMDTRTRKHVRVDYRSVW